MKITIDALQAYLSDRYGGWATEQSMFMKLVEELGEVAEVLNMRAGSFSAGRKTAGRKAACRKAAGRKTADENNLQEQLGTELADMIHYIVAIAAINDIDLTKLIIEKDRVASVKYNHTVNLETFLSDRAE